MTKNTVVQVRMSEEEKGRWAAEAERSDLSLSDWIRRQCNGVEYRPKGVVKTHIDLGKRPGIGAVPDVGKTEPRLPGAVTKPVIAPPVLCSKHKVVNCGRCGDGG